MNTTGTTSLKRLHDSDTPLDKEEHQNKTRKSVVHIPRTQATVALSSGETELYAIGQGINEALYVRSIEFIVLEAEFARKVRIAVYTDSTARKPIVCRFGTGKRTKHVKLRYLRTQNLPATGMLRCLRSALKTNARTFLRSMCRLRLVAHLGLIQSNFRRWLRTVDVFSNLETEHCFIDLSYHVSFGFV